MRDLNKMIEHIEQKTWKRETRAASAAENPKPSPRAWRAPDAGQRPAKAAEGGGHPPASGGAAGHTGGARSGEGTKPVQPGPGPATPRPWAWSSSPPPAR